MCAAYTPSGYTARNPPATATGSTPRCRIAKPVSVTPPAPAQAVRMRPMASALAVPSGPASAATGVISSITPGGCTVMKSLYGTVPWISRTAPPK